MDLHRRPAARELRGLERVGIDAGADDGGDHEEGRVVAEEDLRGFQICNPPPTCVCSNGVDQTLWPRFETSTRAVDASEHRPKFSTSMRPRSRVLKRGGTPPPKAVVGIHTGLEDEVEADLLPEVVADAVEGHLPGPRKVDLCGFQPLVWGVPTKLQNPLARSNQSRFG